jgi:hypothetical protein
MRRPDESPAEHAARVVAERRKRERDEMWQGRQSYVDEGEPRTPRYGRSGGTCDTIRGRRPAPVPRTVNESPYRRV